MAGDTRKVAFEHDNPELTEADFARSRPIADFPELAAAFPNGSKPRGRPKGSVTSGKSLVSLRLDNDVLERFRASGPGWQSRINETLRAAKP
ncbi:MULTISPECIES: BrnA antitoxin family protein [Sphingomonas]|uniref:BrnA antitoxin family protein n=1 Tax=Sphingomonas TaxID=13687 RepID=UPI0020BDB767|nr:BrnA antitoxin family protein [Sphingomonas faeni]MCK8457222.1 BrnA antitoxin family protein [Sphingomonas faeni]